MRRPGLAATATAALVALASVPAHADENIIGLSPDGIRWSSGLTDPLFDPSVRWVPGDVRTARFFIRNQQPDDGDLTVDLLRSREEELLATGDLQISARATGGPWRTVSRSGLQRLVSSDNLRPRSPIAVDIRVAMDAEAPNGTMVLSTDLDLRITLTDSTVVADGAGTVDEPGSSGGVVVLPGGGEMDPVVESTDGTADGSDDAGAGSTASGASGLPATGSAIAPWLPPLGLMLLGTGAYLVARRRQEDEPVEQVLRNGASSLENGLSERP